MTDWSKMIRELLDYDGDSGNPQPGAGNRELTAWEIEFLESVDRRARGPGLTDKQGAKLESIWNAVFG